MQFLSHPSQKLLTFLKTWQRHVTLLKIQDGDVPKTRNTLMNYSHWPLTHIYVQVLYNSIPINLSPHKHHYLIYYLRTFLQILKFGYLASNIMKIQARRLVHFFLKCNPISLQSLNIYGIPITILEFYVGTMNNTTNGHIHEFFLSTMDLGHAKNIMQSYISNRRFQIKTKNIILNVMKLTSYGRKHTECDVPAYPQYLIIILSLENFFMWYFTWFPFRPLARSQRINSHKISRL